ncbi:MAG: response regulator [Burkholderiales bacterium]|nr:response regulator [Burkholderiales bacterium]MDE2566506.1 response regulator [Burkholderiales bacterium]
MLSDLSCPACRSANPPSRLRCSHCGIALRDWEPPAPRAGPSPAAATTGALWLDDLQWPTLDGAPAEAPEATERPQPQTHPAPLTLRDVQPPLPPPSPLPSLPPWEAARGPTAAQPPRSRPGPAELAPKAARRAEVRRALQRDLPPGPAEVLVLDPDRQAREPLCNLLRAFGFDVAVAEDAARAWALSQARPFAVAFVDVPLDGSDGGSGIELCRHLHAQAEALLVLVSAALRPLDRVRAELAGCDATLAKPVSRGSVARVLDSHGIALPADARRG